MQKSLWRPSRVYMLDMKVGIKAIYWSDAKRAKLHKIPRGPFYRVNVAVQKRINDRKLQEFLYGKFPKHLVDQMF